MKANYTPTIGIEIHAELKTQTKMFCDSKNAPHDSATNTHVCPICLAHPGTLPTINKEAVRHVLTVGVALGAELATYTEFDRKNYFYPDIPKGYQISQYEFPLVKGGILSGVAITRIHLEEDTARSQHDKGEGSIVDFNRAGVPLMELVTEPVIHDAKTAGDFARELQLLLRTLGVSDANMERGEMRVEANISVSTTDTFGTKVEVKNLNSFKSVEAAIEFETKRQVELLEKGESVIQETRGWDENKGKTYSQRVKESANDYRYFPDPDLPSLDISLIQDFSLSRLSEKMPTLPSKKREKFINLGIAREQAQILVSDFRIASFFDSLVESSFSNLNQIKIAANYLTSDVLSLVSDDTQLQLANLKQFLLLVEMITEGKITSRVAKDLLSEVILNGASPEKLASERGLLQENSKKTLEPIIERIISDHAGVVAEYKAGKKTALQFLVGQGMKETKGAANPSLLAEILKSKLNS